MRQKIKTQNTTQIGVEGPIIGIVNGGKNNTGVKMKLINKYSARRESLLSRIILWFVRLF